jgi:hypothetical protein
VARVRLLQRIVTHLGSFGERTVVEFRLCDKPFQFRGLTLTVNWILMILTPWRREGDFGERNNSEATSRPL